MHKRLAVPIRSTHEPAPRPVRRRRPRPVRRTRRPPAAHPLPAGRPPARDGGRPRYWLVFLVPVPTAALRYLASGIFCHAGESFYMGGMYNWYVLRTCVTAPLMEELGCRRIAFGKTHRPYHDLVAALAPAAPHRPGSTRKGHDGDGRRWRFPGIAAAPAPFSFHPRQDTGLGRYGDGRKSCKKQGLEAFASSPFVS